MLIDGMSLAEGSVLQNLTVASGTAFPAQANAGELFFLTTDSTLHLHNGTTWIGLGTVASVAGRTGVVVITKADVGLSNVDNTSDADKPVSTAQASALALKADASTVATALAAKANISDVAVLTGGKISTSVLPSLAITDVFAVADQASMLALTAQRGDIAIRSDLMKTFVLSADTPTVLSAWLEVLAPTGTSTTALTLAVPRNIILTGDVAGTASFDGSADASIAVTLKGDIVSTKTFTGSVTCNYASEGSYVAANVTGATTLTITGVPDSVKAYGMTFELTNAGTNITWPASVSWLGTQPTLRTTGISIVTLVTRNGGSTWLGSAA